jgi:hypothetical protein
MIGRHVAPKPDQIFPSPDLPAFDAPSWVLPSVMRVCWPCWTERARTRDLRASSARQLQGRADRRTRAGHRTLDGTIEDGKNTSIFDCMGKVGEGRNTQGDKETHSIGIQVLVEEAAEQHTPSGVPRSRFNASSKPMVRAAMAASNAKAAAQAVTTPHGTLSQTAA